MGNKFDAKTGRDLSQRRGKLIRQGVADDAVLQATDSLMYTTDFVAI
jgi:hypothetical protein